MKRIPWDIGLALLVGLGLGLVYSWVISPTHIVDAQPASLRADFKDQYRSVIAAAYSATGNLPRAQVRLSLLGDADPIEALNAQAQHMLASGASGAQFERADRVAALARALDDEHGDAVLSTPTVEITRSGDNPSSATFPPPASDVPTLLAETPEIVEIQPTPTIRRAHSPPNTHLGPNAWRTIHPDRPGNGL